FIVLLWVCIALTACQTATTAPESFNVSTSAQQDDAALQTGEPEITAPVLPADHWLAGTSDAEDMVPASIAAPASRKLLARYNNAYLEQIGEDRVLHLKGSHYEMGYQHGTLMKEEIIQASRRLRAIGGISWKGNFEASLQEAWDRSSPFIPEKYKQEIQGVTDATGLPLQEVRDFSIFPELFHCSGFALWGKSTADGELLHGRVLDYMRSAGLDQWALIIIQEPTEGNAFVSVAYSGMLGSVTGMNNQQIGIGEMGGHGSEKWDGMPMTFLIRECLESANTLDDVVRIMTDAPRTCQYYYVISDAKADNGRGSAYGVAAEIDSIKFIAHKESYPQLPRPLEDAVTLSAGNRYQCLVDRVEKQYGKFTPQLALDLMARGVSMTSNMHNVLFKPRTFELWAANSTVRKPACNRDYRHYDVSELMREEPKN
ncbi:MAG: hypothetical protein KAH38_02320, partial [Candidatus Hydrogenedentes bacterium]|nr:hypothetical protein [Candidatus Hydrogenedentota bacterium]